jgi:hypothetical protein
MIAAQASRDEALLVVLAAEFLPLGLGESGFDRSALAVIPTRNLTAVHERQLREHGVVTDVLDEAPNGPNVFVVAC